MTALTRKVNNHHASVIREQLFSDKPKTQFGLICHQNIIVDMIWVTGSTGNIFSHKLPEPTKPSNRIMHKQRLA